MNPIPAVPPWQQVPRHLRRSYWELEDEERRALLRTLESEASYRVLEPEEALEDYAAIPDTLGGRLVNGDLAATLLPELRVNPTQGYEALEDPEGRAVVILNLLGKILRDRALELAAGAPVLILMGGQATGKTTGAMALGRAFGAVFDAPHTDPDALHFLIRRIEPTGSELHVAYADRSPEGALLAMLERSEREGRYVPLDRMARTHAHAPHTFLGLHREFGPALALYHVRAAEGGAGTFMAEGARAVESVMARPKPSERDVAYVLQSAYLHHLRNQPHELQAWYPRDVLAGLNRSLDPWRRGEAHHLLQRLCAALAERGAEGGAGPPAGAPPDPPGPGPELS